MSAESPLLSSSSLTWPDDPNSAAGPVDDREEGAALRTGFGRAAGAVVLVQDADLEYDPAQYPQLIQPIFEGTADVVYGSRFIGESHRVLYFWHALANRFLTLLSNTFTNLILT